MEKKQSLKKLEYIKQKHNYWIDGLEKGENFFSFIHQLGSKLFYVLTFVTIGWFWSSYLVGFKNETIFFSGVAILMLNLLRLVMFLVLGGLVFKYFCYYLSIYLEKREIKELWKEGKKI